jgi:putative DNA methylase
MTYRKKLIEVALPLEAINKESAREKTIRHGHPSTLHPWWSRKPLATCRAVLFASLVDDPSEHPERFPTEREQEQERLRLFQLIEQLITWENSNNQELLAKVHAEILASANGELPPVLDCFCGGGSIPLEAQRLGLEAHASDLNPVAVLISKALIEIPPKFAGRPPVNPDARQSLIGSDWHGVRGLTDDIHYYGKWMRDEAEQRIGHLYPKVTLPKEYGGGEATVIAWLWVRTVTCPNPACGAQMPLTSKWWLSKKKGKEAWVEPSVDHTPPPAIHFKAKTGGGKPQDGTVKRQGARCIACGTSVALDHIRSEGKARRMNAQLMAIVAEGQRGRLYLSPTEEQVAIASEAKPAWKPEELVTTPSHDVDRLPMYGMYTWGDAFTPRQLVALTTFSDLVQEAGQRVLTDARAASLLNDERALNDGGVGAVAYADAVVTYLAFVLNKFADISNQLCAWEPVAECPRHLFGRQAIPMVWDFAEGNPFSTSSGSWLVLLDNLVRSFQSPLMAHERPQLGRAEQCDARELVDHSTHFVVSTDPPYYDNIGYADLADFFYIWLRRSVGATYPDLFKTMLVPKAAELIVSPYRFGGSKSKAREFFEAGLGKAFEQMRAVQHPDYPLTVYYAFKQAESEVEDQEDGESRANGSSAKATASTGWETMLEGLIRAGFTIIGTWPMRTEMKTRQVAMNANALASSIVFVCRPRPINAPIASRRQFLNALRNELPDALRKLQHGSIAPVDLAQVSIGPGMAIYSRYSKVVESDGTPLRIRTALQLINSTLDEVLAEQEGEYDGETRWAVAWFEQYAMDAGEYGIAETLSKAKNSTIQNLVDAGFLEAKAGKVRLLKREELSKSWNPKASRLTVWEVMQRMIFALLSGNGETGAADILRSASTQGEVARDLAYRLFVVCERKGWTQEALAYNSLVTSWSEISQLARREASDSGLWEATYLG